MQNETSVGRILHSQFCILQFLGRAEEVSLPARIFR